MVQLYLNNQECDLYGSETIATDYSIAPISNISARSSAKSIAFKMPLTANNRAIIENANVIVNDTVLPYRLIPAKLKANGLTQGIEFAAIESIGEDINIRLFGSNIDFFSIIKGLKLEDLGDDFDHEWDVHEVAQTHNATDGYIYGLIDYHTDSPNTYINDTDAEIDVRGLLPSVYLHSIIDLIISNAGFTAQGDFLSDANYKSVIIPCTGLKIKNALLASATSATAAFPNFLVSFDTPVHDPNGFFQPDGNGDLVYTANYKGTYKVRATFSWVNHDLGDTTIIQLGRYGSELTILSSLTLTTASGSGVLTGEVNCEIGDYIGIGINTGADPLVRISVGALFEVTEAEGEARFGEIYEPTANLGGLKQSDLLKDTAQKFGLIYQVDNVNKVVHIRRFSEIIANIENALDWSDKVDYMEKPELQFNSDYAQRNLCVYSEDDTVVKPTGTDEEILIDNQNLEAEKELFESPFAASEQVERFGGYSIAQIKMFTDLGGADEEIADVEPRYLIVRFQSFSPVFTYTDGSTNLTTTDVPLTHFIIPEQDFNAGFENNLLDYSEDLIALIQEFKLVKMLLRLTAADINQLDFFKPVWIELNGQPGCYYYISMIKQFKVTSKESTEVELVKLAT